MSRRISKQLGYEHLEQRKLLAADLAADIMHCDVDQEPIAYGEVAMELTDSSAIDLSIDAADEIANGEQTGLRIQELDLSDGSDGVFGAMDAENNHSTFSFEPESNGTIEIAVSSSFGDASTNMEVRDSQGDLISATSTEGLDSFQTLRIDVVGGEAYELTVSTEEGVEGNYQVTIGFIPSSVIESDADVASESELATEATDEIAGEADSNLETESESESNDEANCDQINAETQDAGNEASDEVESTVSDSELGETSEIEDNLATENDVEAEPLPSTEPETSDEIQEPATSPVLDLHANDIGAKSTELNMATGHAQMIGKLETAGDVDTFKFTPDFDGTMDLFLADITSENDMDLNVTIFDSEKQEIVDGATNDVVKMTFDVDADTEYYVSVSADEGQTGDYVVVADFNLPEQSLDDHADEVGSNATELVFLDGQWTANGAIETASDQDAFRFTANCNETLTLAMDITSEDHQSAARISVFDDAGDLIVDGTTNDGVDLAFAAVEGVEYQVLVDSTNDIPMTFELTAKTVETAMEDSVGSELLEALVDDRMDDCVENLARCDEGVDSADLVFAEIGDEISQFESSLDSMRTGLRQDTSSLLRFARRT